ncbi:MAG: hypothetical protein ACYC61_25080, partial [Isosphaeraceae bacterium]
WQMQVKRRNEEVMQARSDLHRRKISQQGSDAVSDSEQKEALRDALRRLRIAEEKVTLIRKLIPQLHHAIAEYHSHSQPLGDHISGGFEKSLSVLERMVLSLVAYVATPAPSAPRLDAGLGGGASTSGAATTSSATAAQGSQAEGGAADAEAGGNASAATGDPTSPTSDVAAAPAGEAVLPGRS